METLIVRPKNQKQMAAVEAVLKALNVAFQKEKKALTTLNLWPRF